MSWSGIASALKARIQAVVTAGKTHAMLRYDDGGFERATFAALFQEATGEEIVNAWQVTRTGRTATRSPDNSAVTKLQHSVSIRGNLSFVDGGGATNTEATFQALVDAICLDLDQGDRTLGGAAITHSIPQASPIGHAMFYNSALCHDVTITLTVEENLVKSVTAVPFAAYAPAGTGIESKVEEIGSALVSWFASRVASLSLVSLAWHPHLRGNPTYPADPRQDCPRAFLRVSRIGYVPGKSLSCKTAGFALQLSIWVQLLQTPGKEHQRLIASAVDVFQSALIRSEWKFPTINVDGLYELTAQPAETVIYDELEHPLGEPGLRVSQAETTLTLTGELRG